MKPASIVLLCLAASAVALPKQSASKQNTNSKAPIGGVAETPEPTNNPTATQSNPTNTGLNAASTGKNRSSEGKNASSTGKNASSTTKKSDSTSSSSKATVSTDVDYGKTKIEWGCGENENDIDPGAWVAEAIEKGCGTGNCVSEGLTKDVQWTKADPGNAADDTKSAKVTITPVGSFDPNDKQYFIDAMKGYFSKGVKKEHQTFGDLNKRSINETANAEMVARGEIPPGFQTLHPGHCWLVTQTNNIHMTRRIQAPGDPDSSISGDMQVTVEVDVDDGDSTFCSDFSTIAGALGGNIPGVGAAVSTFFGIAHLACL